MATKPPNPPLKTCRRCGGEFPKTTDFFSRAGKYLQSYCKPCEKAVFHEIYVRNRDAAYDAGTRKKKIPLTKERRRGQANAYYARHREAILAKQRDRYATDPEFRQKRLASHATYRKENPERRTATQQKWWDKNEVRRAEYAAKRRALKANARIEPKISYVGILRQHGRYCHICGKPILLTEKLTFDHIVPLALGGEHSASNLAPAHASCNFRKGARVQ